MNDVRSLVSLGIMAGLGLAVILNAGKAARVIESVSEAMFGLIRTASGTDVAQKK